MDKELAKCISKWVDTATWLLTQQYKTNPNLMIQLLNEECETINKLVKKLTDESVEEVEPLK